MTPFPQKTNPAVPPRVNVTASVHPLAIPIEPHERIVTVGLEIQAPGEAEGGLARPLNLGLVIDTSGSMQGAKIDTARTSACRVVELLSDADTFCLVTFSTAAQLLVPATRVGGQRAQILERIRQLVPDAKTYLAGAL